MAWGVLPSSSDGGPDSAAKPARAKSAVADYANRLDRKAWIDRVHAYGGHAEPVVRHAPKRKAV